MPSLLRLKDHTHLLRGPESFGGIDGCVQRSSESTLRERFESKVLRGNADACWLWTGSRLPTGYGMLRTTSNRVVGAHRVAYLLHKGPIPEGLVIDHTCSVRSCVNPSHLEAVTQSENCMRSVARRRARVV